MLKIYVKGFINQFCKLKQIFVLHLLDRCFRLTRELLFKHQAVLELMIFKQASDMNITNIFLEHYCYTPDTLFTRRRFFFIKQSNKTSTLVKQLQVFNKIGVG